MANEFVVSLLLYRSTNSPSLWIGHSLEFDIVSQGSSLEEAYASISEATRMAIEDDLEHGFDPFSRPIAPKDLHDLYDSVAKSKTRRRVKTLSAEERARMTVVIGQIGVAIPGLEEEPEPEIPPAWLIAAMDQQSVGPSSRRP